MIWEYLDQYYRYTLKEKDLIDYPYNLPEDVCRIVGLKGEISVYHVGLNDFDLHEITQVDRFFLAEGDEVLALERE